MLSYPSIVMAAERPYSTKSLAYSAGVVVLTYWLPFIYLAVFDPKDDGRGGMVLCVSLPIVVVAVGVSIVEISKVIRHSRESRRRVAALPLILFAVTVSPIVVLGLGILRNL